MMYRSITRKKLDQSREESIICYTPQSCETVPYDADEDNIPCMSG